MADRTSVLAALVLAVCPLAARAATRYVAKGGTDASNDCLVQTHACATIAHGIARMAGGDTLVVGDGTYAEPITGMPSGSPAAYTTIRAQNDWGVTIDGSHFPNTFVAGISVGSRSWVTVRGFRVVMSQASYNNGPVQVVDSDHVRIQRCMGAYGPTGRTSTGYDGNAATFDVGPNSSYVLLEECYAFGGTRYMFLVYWSDHVVVRRSVARLDFWDGELQCAGFTNYDSYETAWQNDVVLDSDTAQCSRHSGLYGGFFNENKDDHAPDTSQRLQGNIVLNVRATAGDLDWMISGTRTIEDMVIWDSSGGYWGDETFNVAERDAAPASLTATRMTLGEISGTYDARNGAGAGGTGFGITGSDMPASLTSSLLAHNAWYGVSDYVTSDYNAFFDNGHGNYGGALHTPAAGGHDRTGDVGASLRYLPRIEPGSPLKTAGKDGGQIGAEILFQVGETGTLWGEPGWDTVTTEPLWPFPNEDRIGADMGAYAGPGAPGARGFATGTSLDGTPQTLTKYVWEYLGNEIPEEIYGFGIAVNSLPAGEVGVAYAATLTGHGGVKPYTWSITGSLPAGLTLDPATGAIAGAPMAAGTSTFTVTLRDAGAPSQAASKQLSIAVAEPSGGTQPGGGGGGCRAGDAGWSSLLAVALLALRRRRHMIRPPSMSITCPVT